METPLYRSGIAKRGRRLLVAVALVALFGLTDDALASTDRRIPAPKPAQPTAGSLIARVAPGARVAVRSSPGGPVVASLGSTTEFGSQRALAVPQRRGRWLGVITAELSNGRIGWIDAREHAVTYARTRLRIEVDLSRLELLLHRGDTLVRRFTVSVGRSGSATPIGRFAVTDKLPGPRFSAVYGCCILALSGHQTNLPAGWTGGDRLAIHGTPGDSVGGAVSAGCVHARESDLRMLMDTVPLGTPVVIHP